MLAPGSSSLKPPRFVRTVTRRAYRTEKPQPTWERGPGLSIFIRARWRGRRPCIWDSGPNAQRVSTAPYLGGILWWWLTSALNWAGRGPAKKKPQSALADWGKVIGPNCKRRLLE